MAYLDCVFFRALSGGTGDFVVDTPIQGYQTPAAASAANGATYGYRAESDDLTQWEYGTTVYTVSGTSCTRVVSGNSLGTTAKINFTAPPKVGFVELSAQLSSAASLTSGIIPSIGRIATGTSDGKKFVRDDRALAYPAQASLLTSPGTDLNTVQTPGAWDGSNFVNAPNGSIDWFYIEVTRHSSYVAGTNVYVLQTATGLTNSTNGRWSRVCIGNTWSAWRRLDSRCLLATLTASASASLDFTGFSSEFDDYEIVLENIIPTATNVTTKFRYFVGGAFQTANYQGNRLGGSGGAANSTFTNGIDLSGSNVTSNNSAHGLCSRATIFNVNQTSKYKFLRAETAHLETGSGNVAVQMTGGQYRGSTAAVTGIRLICETTTIASGTMKVFGLT